jgi:type VI protein secretion system component Hcp
VVVSRCSSSSTASRERDAHGFLDRVTLAYATIQWEYQTIGPDGKPSGGPTKGGWDVKKNQPI